MTIPPGATSNSIQIGFYDDSGLPLTGKVAADFPTVSYQKSGANAAVTISLSDLSTLTSAWSSGGVKEIGNGKYRLDVPDAAFTTATRLDISGDTTGKHVIAPPIDVQYVQSDLEYIAGAVLNVNSAQIGVKVISGAANCYTSSNFSNNCFISAQFAGSFFNNLFAPAVRSGVTAQAGSSTTVTLDSGASASDNFYNGCTVYISAGAGAGQARAIKTYVGATKVATVDHAWTTAPDNTSTIYVYATDLAALDASLQVAASAVNGNVSGSVGSVTGNVGGSIAGDVQGKILGAGGSVITAAGVWSLDGSGAALATASALSTAQTSINNINNLSALANLIWSGSMVRPSTSSIAYPLTFVVKDVEGHLVDVDSNAVTLTAKNAAGTDRSANLSAVTHTGTGEYTFTYTVSSAHADEGLTITAAGTYQTASRKAWVNTDVVDANSLAALAAIQAQTDKFQFNGSNYVLSAPQTTVQLATTQPNYAPAKAGDQMDLVSAPNATAVTAIQSGLATSSALTTVGNNITTLLSRMGAITGTGINTVLGYFRAMVNKLAGLTPSDLTSGGATFDNTEDSLEAQHDAGASVTVAGYAAGQDPATLVLDVAASSHNTANSIGAKINSAAAAGDPLQNDVPGDYAAGTAGYALVHIDSSVDVTITPIQANVTNPRYATRDLSAIAAGSAPTEVWIITDANGSAIDLSAKSVRMVVYAVTSDTDRRDFNPFTATITPKFKYETGGSGITIGGTSNNNVSVQQDAAKTATAGIYHYWLLNVTDRIPLARGRLTIEPAIWDV